MRRFKIGVRLALGFGALMAMIATMIAAGAMFGTRTSSSIRDVKRKSIIIADVKEAVSGLRLAELQTWSFVATNDDRHLADRAAAIKRTAEAYADLDRTLTLTASRDILATIRGLSSQTALAQQKIIDLQNAGVSLDSRQYLKALNAWKEASEACETAMGHYTVYHQAAADNAMALAEQNTTDAFNLSLALGSSAIVLGASLAWAIGRSIAHPVRAMTGAMAGIAEGDLSIFVPDTGVPDEVGDMAAAVQVFKDNGLKLRAAEAAAIAQREAAERDRSAREAAEAELHQRQQAMIVTLAEGLDSLSQGNLTRRLEQAFPREYEKLRADFNAAAVALQLAMKTIVTAAGTIDSGSNEIAQASNGLARRTELQAAGIEETSMTLNSITETVQAMAAGSDQATNFATAARHAAESSGRIVEHAVEAMENIRASSLKIASFTGIIDEIAFQTNLLALNAGVEAARAGDAGRGFAVVASEVRALAQRSASAAKEISALIKASAVQVNQGVELVGQTGVALRDIADKISGIDDIVKQSAAGLQQQAASLSEVNIAIHQMDEVVQQNAAMVEQSSAAAYALKTETEGLTTMVGRFKIEHARTA